MDVLSSHCGPTGCHTAVPQSQWLVGVGWSLATPPQGPHRAPSAGLRTVSNLPSRWIGLFSKCDRGLSSKRIGKWLLLSVLSQKQSQLRFNIHHTLVRYSEPARTGKLVLLGRESASLFQPHFSLFPLWTQMPPDTGTGVQAWENHWGFPTRPGHHAPVLAEVILSVAEMTLQVSVVSVKAPWCERGLVSFLRCLYWLKYRRLCPSRPSSRPLLPPSCVFVHVSVIACFHLDLSNLFLWLSTLFPRDSELLMSRQGASSACVHISQASYSSVNMLIKLS